MTLDESPLEQAIRLGDVDAARRALDEGADPNEPDYLGVPLAQSALDAGNEDLVHLLVSFGATFAWPDSDGRQPMHAVASASDSPRRIEMLLAAGVAPDPLTPEGWTPLHFAAIYGYSSVVEALLGHKADPCLTTRTGLSPADLARTNGHEILAERLERACDERARGG